MLYLPGDDLLLFAELVASLIEAQSHSALEELLLGLAIGGEQLDLVRLSLVQVGHRLVCHFCAKGCLSKEDNDNPAHGGGQGGEGRN